MTDGDDDNLVRTNTVVDSVSESRWNELGFCHVLE